MYRLLLLILAFISTLALNALAVQDATSSGNGRFEDKDLDLRFNYPVEMRIVDANEAMEKGHEALFGRAGATAPEHVEAKKCTRPLLYVELPKENAPNRPASLEGVWVEDPHLMKVPGIPAQIIAKIMLVEIVRDCISKKQLKKEDDLLGGLAMSAVEMPGFQPMPKPLWYEIGKQKIHMNSSGGKLQANDQAAALPTFLMSMSTAWKGHFLVWLFWSNDTVIFNELTKSEVQFGNSEWGPMFAANIGTKNGTPVNVLPK